MNVEIGIVRQQRGITDKLRKAMESFAVREDFAVLTLSNDRIYYIAEHYGNLAFGLYMHHKGAQYLLSPYLHCGNLDDVIMESVESCRLCVKDYQLFFLVCTGKTLGVSRGVVLIHRQ